MLSSCTITILTLTTLALNAMAFPFISTERPVAKEILKRGQSMAEHFVPIAGITLACDPTPTEAENLAVCHFIREMQRITGHALPVSWGDHLGDQARILVGNRSTLSKYFIEGNYGLSLGRDAEDIANQSYVVDAFCPKGARSPCILAAGFGQKRTPRGYLGMSYALGELLRRLDLRNGQWGFVLPSQPIIASPKMPNRTLYLMNSDHCNPGLSLEYFKDAQIEDYVDQLVDARYSRIAFWQWSLLYLYPGNADDRRPKNQRIHQVMRKVFDRARRRGLEVYHQISPSHIHPNILPDNPRLIATGYYRPFSICWSQPEARELARKVMQAEMEYYGPVDGYVVWFYDPGGCFCQDCSTHQAERLFDQLSTIVNLAKTISPGAKFQASLWPTWSFPSHPNGIGFPGKGYKAEEVKAFVEAFLSKCLSQFGPRGLTILDSCEADNTNIYNGFVKPGEFQRSAFLYTVLGMASEQRYPFALFKLGYISEQMGKARDRGIEEGMLFIQYAATNFPGVFAFADTLYEDGATWEGTARRLAAALAKGEAQKPFLDFLSAMEELTHAKNHMEMEKAIRRAEQAAAHVAQSPRFFGNKDWLKGYLKAQRYYLQLAQATDEKVFTEILTQFKADLSAIPMYTHYASQTLDLELVRAHIRTYWHTL
jgi:hypothetical protein